MYSYYVRNGLTKDIHVMRIKLLLIWKIQQSDNQIKAVLLCRNFKNDLVISKPLKLIGTITHKDKHPNAYYSITCEELEEATLSFVQLQLRYFSACICAYSKTSNNQKIKNRNTNID